MLILIKFIVLISIIIFASITFSKKNSEFGFHPEESKLPSKSLSFDNKFSEDKISHVEFNEVSPRILLVGDAKTNSDLILSIESDDVAR